MLVKLYISALQCTKATVVGLISDVFAGAVSGTEGVGGEGTTDIIDGVSTT